MKPSASVRLAMLVAALGLGLGPDAVAQPYTDSACHPDCYVGPAGSDQNGNGTAGNPWKTLIKCLCEVRPGGSCVFLPGTYDAPQCSAKFSNGSACTNDYGWWLDPGRDQQDQYSCTRRLRCGTAGNAVTIRSQDGADSVLFGQYSPAGTCNDHMTVEGGCDYLTFEGITFGAGRNFFDDGSSNITFTKNVLKCPGTRDGSNNSVLMSGSNLVTGCDNWLVKDNLFFMDSTCNATCNPGAMNFTKMYSQDGSVWENNDFLIDSTFSGTAAFVVSFKSSNQEVKFRYNHIESLKADGASLGLSMDNTGYGANGNNQIYQNVIVNTDIGIQQKENPELQDDDFYNNTLYDVGTCYQSRPDSLHTGTQYFNNLCVSTPGGTAVVIDGNNVGQGIPQQAYWNHNLYFEHGGDGILTFKHGLVPLPTFAGWQAFLTTLGVPASLREGASRVTNPLLVDPDAGDYRLGPTSPAQSGGRGDGFSTTLGAYLTGDEVIGCQFHPLCFSHGIDGGGDDDDTPPGNIGDVGNLHRTDM
jgi:hypothetical protein